MREPPAPTRPFLGALIACTSALVALPAVPGSAQASQVYATNPPLVAEYHRSTYFVGGTGRFSGLYRTDGTHAGTVLVKHLGDGIDVLPTAPTVVGDRMLFTVSDAGRGGASAYASDGTRAGTRRTRERPPRAPGRRVATLDDGGTFFVTNDRPRLVYRGSQTGARPVTIAQVGDEFAFGVTAGALYFAGTDGEHGTEPWISDGTIAGTHLIADLTAGQASSDFGWTREQGNTFPTGFVNAGGAMYALAAPSQYPANVPHTPYLVSGPSPGAPVTIDGAPAGIPLAGQVTGTPTGLWFQAGDQLAPERLRVAPGSTVAERPGGPAVDDQGTLIAPGSGVYVSGNTLRRGDAPEGNGPIVLATTGRAAPSRNGDEPAINLVTRVGGDTWFLAPVVDDGPPVLWRSDGTAPGTGPVVLPGQIDPVGSSLTATVDRPRDRRSPYRWRFTGSVTASGIAPESAADACHGTVSIRLLAYGTERTLQRARVAVRWSGAACTFAGTVTARSSTVRGQRGKLTAAIRFVGDEHVHGTGNARRIGLRFG